MELVPPWVTLAISSISFSLLLILLFVGFSTIRNRASMRLGFIFAGRNLKESLTRSLPVALLCAIIIASLSIGDGLILMVDQNTKENLSGVDLVIDIPGYVDRQVVIDSLVEAENHVIEWEMMIALDGIGESQQTGNREGIKVMGVLNGADTILGVSASTELDGRTDAYVNIELARKLDLKKGDQFHISVYDVGSEQDNLLGYSSASSPEIALNIVDIIENDGIGRYREDALGKIDPICVMQYSYLSERIQKERLVNKVLINVDNHHEEEAIELITENFDERLTIEDAGFRIEDKDGRMILTHEDFFFHPEEVGLEPDDGTLSYFVDNLTTDHSKISHSVVTGVPSDYWFKGLDDPTSQYRLTRGEVLVTNWTIGKMDLSYGETLRISYRRVSELGILMEQEKLFTVEEGIPMENWTAWDGWIPDIPGVTEAPSCGDWDPSFGIDIDSLTGDDYEYWNLYRTIPKCYIHIDDAREMWGIPSGNTTMVILDEGNFTEQDVQERSDELSGHITLGSMGGSIKNVREDALASSRAMLIFPGMFLTFGSIIMIGALMVLYALFKDLAGKRAHEWGILRAVGVTRKDLLISGSYEALWPILFGSALGLVLGYIIGGLLNLGLRSAWSNSVEDATVPFTISGGTILISLATAILLAYIVVIISVVKEARGAPIANIRDKDPTVTSTNKWMKLRAYTAGIILLMGSIGVLVFGSTRTGMDSAGLFVVGSIMISSGAGLLIYHLISRVKRGSDLQLMVTSNLTRRPGKNPLSIGILALMLTLAISLTLMGSMMEEEVSSSYEEYGGGFSWVVETAVPHRGELDDLPNEVSVLLSIGEEGGTCSNINAPYPPRLLGIEEGFETVSDFGLIEFDDRYSSASTTWTGLHERINGKIPIMVDQNTLQWIYFESLGSEFEITSESGEELILMVVGILEPSVLTGTFVMSKTILKDEFTSIAKPTFFLIKGSGDENEKEIISQQFEDSFPTISSVKGLARENLDYELSYLYLFRDFLVFGLIVAMSSAAVFTHVRALSLRQEMATLRSIGVTKKRSIQYFLTENSIIFLIATAAAVVGSIVSVLIFGALLGGAVPSSSSIVPSLVVVISFMGVAILISLTSAIWALKDFRKFKLRD